MCTFECKGRTGLREAMDISGLFLNGPVRFSPEGGCFARNHFKRSVSARFIAYEARSHRTSPRGSSWVQALPGKFRGNHNPGFDRGNFCPFPGAYLGSHTPGIPGISGSTWEHTHPGAYSGRETRVFPGGRWEPRSQPRSWPRKNPGTGWIPGFSRVVLLGVEPRFQRRSLDPDATGVPPWLGAQVVPPGVACHVIRQTHYRSI